MSVALVLLSMPAAPILALIVTTAGSKDFIVCQERQASSLVSFDKHEEVS